MKISQSLTIQITNETVVASYHNGNSQSCTFIEAEESLSIYFDQNCISKLFETIQKLQKIHQTLIQERQKQIAREFDRLSLSSSTLPVYLSKGNSAEEVEVTF